MFRDVGVYPNVIKHQDIDKFIADVQYFKYNEATTNLSTPESPYDLRRTQVRSMTLYQSPVINQAVQCIARYINGRNLVVETFRREIQLLRYSHRDYGPDFFGKHIDVYENALHRVVSTSVLLSDGSEYEGGDLIFYNGSRRFVAPKEKGTVICFPSGTWHEVTPVTAGVRYSLVIWSGSK